MVKATGRASTMAAKYYLKDLAVFLCKVVLGHHILVYNLGAS
jgi:hypothetical protein